MPAIATAGRATLRDYGGSGRPVIFVPSLINPPFVLDLAAHNSLLRWLATQGLRPLLVDWGEPTAAESTLDIGGHVEHLLLPLIDALDDPPLIAGYCLGGTMAMAAAALRPMAGLALIAAPWHFSGFDGAARADMISLWSSARGAAHSLGVVPVEVLQAGFWRLDPARTIGKYEAFAAMAPDSDAARAFIALEDWANAGAPLTYAAGRQLFEDFVDHDSSGAGAWTVAGTVIDPTALSCPTLDIISTSDRIVPAASASRLPNQLMLGAGHVGMIVGGRARTQLWEPLAQWLSHLQQK